ncbi:MAG: hypothetical protein KAS59_03335 [Alphaproteobacteria bacterium]|nr:hypothetical protein [Alphaproteobacteria bacterium]MCK5555693.1 hypothetical protein [Alphaproteobacteria bacterium]
MGRTSGAFNRNAGEHKEPLIGETVIVDPKNRGNFDETHNGSKFSSYDSFQVIGEHMDPDNIKIIKFKNPSGHRGKGKASDFVIS